MTADSVIKDALSLNLDDRAKVAAAVSNSLGADYSPEVDDEDGQTLLEITRQRRDELHSGKVEPVTFEELKNIVGT